MKKLSKTMEDELEQGYQEEFELYQSMLKINLEQNRAIKSGDIKRVFSLGNQKQEIVSKVDEIESRLSPWKKERTESKFPPINEELSALIKKIGSLLEKILVQEKENEFCLEIFLANIGQNLEHIQTGKILHNAYSYHKTPARFMDQKR